MSYIGERIPTRISPDMLDTIGRSFRFSHGKGVAEWLKNALDQYLRRVNAGAETMSGGWPVFLCMIDGPMKSRNHIAPSLALIDFGGSSYKLIEDFFLHWGDTSAATLGGRAPITALTGGHGNGGKFYMREMWTNGARLLTWLDGRATSLVVDRKDKATTGVWEIVDEPMDWRAAFGKAMPDADKRGDTEGIIRYLENECPKLVNEMDAGDRGFTAVVGLDAIQLLSSNDVVKGRTWDYQKLIDNIRQAPQARRPLRELQVSVFVNGALKLERLHPEVVEDDAEWGITVIEMPRSVISGDDSEHLEHVAGTLILRKAGKPLTGKHAYQNAVFVLDAAGNPIASYPMRDLPLPGHSPLTQFFHGELQLFFSGFEKLVENDRERLVMSPVTAEILEWTANNIWTRIKALEEEQRQAQRNEELSIASVLNKSLNAYARRFLEELETEVMIDFLEDITGGGPGDVGHGEGPNKNMPGNQIAGERGRGGQDGSGGTKPVSPGQTEKVRRPRFPQILLSGYDSDPSTNDGSTKMLSELHPPIHQDDTDRIHNIWWINTMHPFARAALRDGAENPWFRSYQVHMFVQVVQIESIRLEYRRQAELELDQVENSLTRMANDFLAQLNHDLVERLLNA